MSGQEWSTVEPDRALIAGALKALAALDPATRPKSGLARRAGISRVTLDKVFAGDDVADAKLMALDDAVQVPPGTLRSIGDGAPVESLGLAPAQVTTLLRTSHSKGPARNRKVV